jgi:hypothetical protein
MNQRNSMLYCVCSMSRHSERPLNKICSSIAASSFSGAMLGRPPLMSAWYIVRQRVHLHQRLFDCTPDAAQRMIGRNEIVPPSHGEQAFGE